MSEGLSSQRVMRAVLKRVMFHFNPSSEGRRVAVKPLPVLACVSTCRDGARRVKFGPPGVAKAGDA